MTALKSASSARARSVSLALRFGFMAAVLAARRTAAAAGCTNVLIG
jgi:hypothetical protein